MRVLVLSQHFPPEITAASFRIRAFAEALADRGHEVEVVCPVPNHPRGVIEPGFRGRATVRRSVNGVRVRHLWVFARPRKTTLARLGYYGSYAAAASLAGPLMPRPDVVLASSPPLTVGVAGVASAAVHRCPLVFDVRDLWPESAVAFGELTDGRMVRGLERLERYLYRRSDLILTPNDAFRRQIGSQTTTRVEVAPNGTTRDWLTAGETEVDREELGLSPDRFVWAYAGNLGLAHPLDDAVDAAAALGDQFQLLVIGDGPRRAALVERASGLPPGSVEFRPLMPPAEAARHLRAADAVLVAERQPKTVPAKLYDCAAIGRPVVAICGGELERVVTEKEIAVPVPLDDPTGLAEGLRRLRGDRALGGQLVERARSFAESHQRDRQAAEVARLLEELAG